MKRIALRLDDGSLIGWAAFMGSHPGDHRAVRVTIDQAAEFGRASEEEVTRLKHILQKLAAQPSMPMAMHQGPPSKKARVDSFMQPAQAPLHAPVHAAALGSVPDWYRKCTDILERTIKVIKSGMAAAFINPVDPSALPDYYRVIQRPMFLCDIRKRIAERQYTSPEQFAADMRLHFQNVKLYNPERDPYRLEGEKAQRQFESMWRTSGLAGLAQDLGKRATAGQAAPKFEAEVYDAPTRSKPSRSGKPQQQTEAGAPEVASGRLPPERVALIGAFFGGDDIPEQYTDHFLSLLPQHIREGAESGELELDFDQLDNETLRKVDMWLRTVPEFLAMSGGQPAPAAQPLPSAGAGLRADSYSDEDYNGGDSEDTDD